MQVGDIIRAELPGQKPFENSRGQRVVPVSQTIPMIYRQFYAYLYTRKTPTFIRRLREITIYQTVGHRMDSGVYRIVHKRVNREIDKR
ncbi:hypothetical protein AN957_09870 [Cytobacillus solani]|uniref:Uncharacterized protein n=1 Tax=Cytobacillus solani TaxID=1637975 RepID=A0A0Q3T5T8_9BACI|nr:hypothetical protein AN957_09870 [Cytobacillus solani]